MPNSDSVLHQSNLDALERRAVEAITNTYGPFHPDSPNAVDRQAAFWAQKGIEGMRLAVAEAIQQLEDEGC